MSTLTTTPISHLLFTGENPQRREAEQIPLCSGFEKYEEKLLETIVIDSAMM